MSSWYQGPHKWNRPVRTADPPSDPTPDQMLQRAQQSSLTWPRHWRKCIYKMTRMHSIDTASIYFVIHPRNPEYDTYLEQPTIDLLAVPPPPYLDPIEFDTLEEVETWARVICRLDT